MTELRIHRLVIEDDQGRTRAVIECGASPDPPGDGGVNLTLFAATGDPMLCAEIDDDGQPRLSVGHSDRGASLILMRTELQLWEGGNAVAVLSAFDGGQLIFKDKAGNPVFQFPNSNPNPRRST